MGCGVTSFSVVLYSIASCFGTVCAVVTLLGPLGLVLISVVCCTVIQLSPCKVCERTQDQKRKFCVFLYLTKEGGAGEKMKNEKSHGSLPISETQELKAGMNSTD